MMCICYRDICSFSFLFDYHMWIFCVALVICISCEQALGDVVLNHRCAQKQVNYWSSMIILLKQLFVGSCFHVANLVGHIRCCHISWWNSSLLISESKWHLEHFWWEAWLGAWSNCLWWSKFSGLWKSFKWYFILFFCFPPKLWWIKGRKSSIIFTIFGRELTLELICCSCCAQGIYSMQHPILIIQRTSWETI